MEDNNGTPKKRKQTKPFDKLKQFRKQQLRAQQLLSAIRPAKQDLSPNDTRLVPRPMVAWTFSRDLRWMVDGFTKLPAHAAQTDKTGQRLVLVCLDLPRTIIGVEIFGDTTIGRSSGDFSPDLDVGQYGESEHGVSRVHAMLRPVDDKIEIVDMGSTNGTRHNGTRIMPTQPKTLKDKDILTFGTLQFQIRFVITDE